MRERFQAELERLLAPIRTRIRNTIARAVVQLVDDGAKMQGLQIGVLAGETIDDAERVQQYGLTSVPLEGADAVVLFPNGDRGLPLVVAVDDKRHRPTGLKAGEVALYNNAGAQVVMKANGDIEVTPASGGEILAGGSASLATKADLDALKTYLDEHTHTGVTTGGGSSGPPAPSPSPSGTGTLKGS